VESPSKVIFFFNNLFTPVLKLEKTIVKMRRHESSTDLAAGEFATSLTASQTTLRLFLPMMKKEQVFNNNKQHLSILT
jgi:response regulator of citrate/malate metabolism